MPCPCAYVKIQNNLFSALLSTNQLKSGSPDLFGQADAVVKHVLEGHDRYHFHFLYICVKSVLRQGSELGQFPPEHAPHHQRSRRPADQAVEDER